MSRYKAVLAKGASIEDAKLEIETCGGSAINVSGDSKSIEFDADADNIPAIEGMSSIESVEPDNGIYRGLKLKA